MNLRLFFLVPLLLCVSGALNIVVSASELAAGKTKAETMCQTCHGMNGKATIPLAANLGGQQKGYLKLQLEAYRSGERRHEPMNIISKMLSDDDIDQLAEWYASIKVTFELPK